MAAAGKLQKLHAGLEVLKGLSQPFVKAVLCRCGLALDTVLWYH